MRNYSTRATAFLSSAGAFVCLAAHPAYGKDETNGQALEEIIVTAERHPGSVQTTPISIQVYSSDELAARGVANVQQLSAIDPSINLGGSGGQPTVSIRGVANSNATETGEPAVGIATDGVFNNRAYSLSATYYDLERIEILRGPQGTLFGRNTTGGMLNVITQRPKDEFAGRVTVDVGNYEARFIDGFLNVPLAENLKTRFAFSSRDRDGFRRPPPIGQRGDDENSRSIRLGLQFDPTPDFSAWISASYTHEGGMGPITETVTPLRFPAGATSGEPLHAIPPNISDGVHFNIPVLVKQNIDTLDLKWNLSYSGLPSGITLTYLGGYNKINYERPLALILGGMPAAFTRREKPVTINNELRLSSSADSRFFWQVGAYYFKEDSSLYSTMVTNPGNPNELLQYYFDTPKVKSESKAVYGQASYKITDALKLTVGGRYTKDEKVRRGSQIFPNVSTVFGQPRTLTGNQNGESENSKFTWLAGADYQISDRNMIYAKISTGYKAGGFVSGVPYDPENVKSYEIGSKNRFLDGNLQINVSAYKMDYTDQQITQYLILVPNTPATAVTTNAGKSKIYGVETNASAIIGPLGRLDIAVNYLHAEFKDYLVALPWARGQTRQLAGNVLANSPKWSISAGFEHTFEKVLGGEITGRVDALYKSKFYFSPFNFPDDTQKSVTILDANLIYRPDDGRWRLQAYVQNLTNEKRFVAMAEQPNVGYTFQYGAPRQYGVRVSADF